MNGLDILLLIVITFVVGYAVWHIIKRKKEQYQALAVTAVSNVADLKIVIK